MDNQGKIDTTKKFNIKIGYLIALRISLFLRRRIHVIKNGIDTIVEVDAIGSF